MGKYRKNQEIIKLIIKNDLDQIIVKIIGWKSMIGIITFIH